MNAIPEWAEAVCKSLMTALRERDPYTFGHCMRVARHARLLAKAAGLDEDLQRLVQYASLFHDLGKLGIPDAILLKPGRLNPREEAIMRSHPVRSVEILAPLTQVPLFQSTLPGIRYHHERIDGQGYPDGIQGMDIPLVARIIVIADTFDAMTTNRPYRSALAEEQAYRELKQFAGRQFDRELGKVFLKAHPTWGELEEEITQEFVADHYLRAA